MAEIPVVKRSGGLPWWAWLILAAPLVGLLFFMFDDDGRDEQTVDNMAVVEVPVTDAGADQAMVTGTDATAMAGEDIAGTSRSTGVITDLAAIADAAGTSLVGRDVRLIGVTAGEVPDDAGFWLDAAAGKRVWVVLDEVRTPNTPIEGRVDVDKGDRVDVTGSIRSAAGGSPPDAAIPGPTKPLPAGIAHYIYATGVTQSR